SWNSTNFRLVGDVAGGGLAVVSEVVGGDGASISKLLGTDLRTEMLGVNSTFYTRIPFAVRDPTEFNHLILKMKYDDAFVAHINGTEVARRNVTGATAWNSAADSPRLGDEVLAYEEIDISSFMSLLLPGVNVLAIQGLNVSEADADVLILPEVTATDEISTSTGYFTTPTPGAANGFGFVDIVGDTTFGVDRGFYDAAFDVAITSATTGAQIYYTTNGDAPTQANGILYSGPIHIDKTTTLRAAAFHPGYLPTNVDTQTYLFLNDVIRQSHQATLDAGFPSTWGGTSPDYGMDPDVIGTFDANGNPLGGDSFGGVYAATIKDDLLSIPTLSIVMNTNELFGPNGIYTNSTQRGVAWERATSVELIHPDGAEGFQVDAGIRIQGGAFRSHSLTKKHSLRLLFKNVYGPGKLSFPWFSAGAVDEFNTITLRAGANDGYTWGPAQFTEQYIRDEFGRGLQRAAGHPSSHGTFVHLYINGIYWGLYNPVERPDNEFAASYEGGDPDNWDSIHDGAATEGDLAAWNAMFAKAQQAGSSLAAFMELQGKNLEGTPHATAAPLLDVVNYVDYIAINAWGGNWDWPRKNYWAARDRDPATTTGFKFFNWDFENTMGNNRDRSPLNATALDQDFAGSGNAGQPHLHLLQSPEYRLLFADRVHKMFFNDGILTADKLSVRYQQLADQIERAIVAESARWGDTKHHPPMTLAEWRNERDWILNTYLQQRTGIVLNELKGYGLYPMIVAPSFNQHGGHVPVGFDLSISAPAGAIWYTLDGSDPREIGGATSPTAILHDGTPIEIPAGMTVRARARVGSEWSALNEAAFITGAPANATNLRITELHYNPAAQVGVADPGELEFIEFLNPSSERVSLADVQITQFAATPYTFDSDLSLGPGERMIVARNPAVFQSVYGTGMRVALVGYGGASLSNGGERIAVMGPLGVIQDFVYDEQPPWPTAADGAGASLEIIDPMGDPSDPANWRASFYPGGSPGEEGFSLPGDYDRNRIVDRADHLVWRASFGLSIAPGTAADGNGNGVVDAADYVLWRRNMSLAASATSVASVSAVAASTPIQVIETRRLTAAGRDQGHLTVLKPAPVTTGTSLHSRPAYRPLSPMPGDNAVSSQQLLLDVALPASSSLDSDSAIEDPSKTEDGELAEVAAAVWEELFGSVEILGAR
ncbi:MAG TPA: CotH kinase family protein, partial [Lacipirellulaceae bacterium]